MERERIFQTSKEYSNTKPNLKEILRDFSLDRREASIYRKGETGKANKKIEHHLLTHRLKAIQKNCKSNHNYSSW